MHNKKQYTLITFATTSGAMHAEQRLLAAGAPGRLIPTPASITAGCGLAWRTAPQAAQAALHILGEGWERVYEDFWF